ncbi:hypothetical protein [Microcoleus sp. PH2017_24_DOB_U_A]|uniref:hypothetical protein n=1 Tax=Microcoleus sp. PH2017_24_DOB_U_A TaxID=2798834 RepID=UPI001D6DF713|nr:hypothetical protein [Microcoleus sp. PH2017_24_DOB_U_A]MCC3550914.1 hypothetical protein [Microcoleus sp. PH2017_24_DOB_U_A]
MPNISQITPALIGFATVAIAIILTNNYKFIKNYIFKKPVVLSLIFISSGFIFQLVYSNRVSIQIFSDNYKNLLSLPPISIISTILAVFLGNTLLRKIAEQKEKKEIAILFENTIDTHIKIIRFIDCYLKSSELYSNDIQKVENLKKIIDIYLSQLKDDVYYETTFKKVGIYNENEIDFISLYSSEKQLFISYLKRFLIRLDNWIDALKNNQDNQDNQGILKTKADLSLILEITIFSSLKTKFFATLCLLIFSVYSNSEKQSLYQKDLQDISDSFSNLIQKKTLPSVDFVFNHNTYLNELEVMKLKIENFPETLKEDIKSKLSFMSTVELTGIAIATFPFTSQKRSPFNLTKSSQMKVFKLS